MRGELRQCVLFPRKSQQNSRTKFPLCCTHIQRSFSVPHCSRLPLRLHSVVHLSQAWHAHHSITSIHVQGTQAVHRAHQTAGTTASGKMPPLVGALTPQSKGAATPGGGGVSPLIVNKFDYVTKLVTSHENQVTQQVSSATSHACMQTHSTAGNFSFGLPDHQFICQSIKHTAAPAIPALYQDVSTLHLGSVPPISLHHDTSPTAEQQHHRICPPE